MNRRHYGLWSRQGFSGAVLVILRAVIGALFLWSGSLKLGNPYATLISIYGYELIGPRVSLVIAVLLPSVEIAIGACLLAGIMVEGAFCFASLLGLAFAVAAGSIMLRGIEVSCGCFGASDKSVSLRTIFISGGVLAGAVLGYCLSVTCRSSVGADGEPDDADVRLAAAESELV
jgi:uncharacterized membrane protein YphA (DoxX/SURF4 family)